MANTPPTEEKAFTSSTEQFQMNSLRNRNVPDVPEDVDYMMEHLNDPNLRDAFIALSFRDIHGRSCLCHWCSSKRTYLLSLQHSHPPWTRL